ncbi:hypothetical protein [Streptomyces sp. NPDC092952]|uniref:hypothetical protein n=1 Tax=Streptomyces sp. NPDC092952 TaxID=3366018 RepID=UPI0037F29DD0
MTDQPNAQPQNAATEAVWQVPGAGHTHWAWACREESGGCGYESPFYSPTRDGAQYGFDTHRTTCRRAN